MGTYSANTLFCWEFYLGETGSTKKSYELELMRTQLFLKASIFGCEDWKVYSDVETWIAPEPNAVNTVKIDDVNNDFHFAKRKKTEEEGLWEHRDWTVKVDIDAVFLPIRLRERLGQVEVTENGIYLENCKYVNFGFFGSLEVF